MPRDMVGLNINTRFGFITAVDYAALLGAGTMQVFLQGNRGYGSKRKTAEQLAALKKSSRRHKIRTVVHSGYLLNFCNPDCKEKKVKRLTEDLEDAHAMGAIGAIIHMGNACHLEVDEAWDNYVAGVKKAMDAVPQGTVILETGTGSGTEIATMLPSLGKLRKKFGKKYIGRIKFCLDTCHMFTAGYSLDDRDMVPLIVQQVDIFLGWHNVACIHLNDSCDPQWSQKDHHADIGKGMIRKAGLKKFVQLVDQQPYDIPLIMETPTKYYNKKGDALKFPKEMRGQDRKKVTAWAKERGYTRYSFGEQAELVRGWIDQGRGDKRVRIKRTKKSE